MTIPVRPPARIFRLSTVSNGSQMIVGADLGGLTHDLITIIADDDESLWVRLDTGNHLVEVPLQIVLSAVKAAQEEVHSEHWFEENFYQKVHDSEEE